MTSRRRPRVPRRVRAGFLLSIIPTTLLSSLTGPSILQTLFVALLVGFALQKMGSAGKPILRGIGHIQALVFRILVMIMWLAPIGAFGAIAAVVGETGVQAIISMATLMIAFYITCILFIVVILGGLLKIVTGVNIFKLMKYLGREFLLIFMIIASKGAAGVTGAGIATLAGGLQSHRPDLVEGVGLIVGIDRFMSEARALTNVTGNAVATVLIGTWTREIDRGRVDEVLEGSLPFDETTMSTDHRFDNGDDIQGEIEDGVAVKTEAAVSSTTAR